MIIYKYNLVFGINIQHINVKDHSYFADLPSPSPIKKEEYNNCLDGQSVYLIPAIALHILRILSY